MPEPPTPEFRSLFEQSPGALLPEVLLRLVTDALPVLVAFVAPEERYRLVDKAYEDRFGQSQASRLGRTVREFIGEAAYAVMSAYVRLDELGIMTLSLPRKCHCRLPDVRHLQDAHRLQLQPFQARFGLWISTRS